MRIVIQRVDRASVSVEGKVAGAIGTGLLVLAGIAEEDNEEDVQWLSRKIAGLRIFSDAAGVMNLTVGEVDGRVLLVSQFTLHASTKKGNRPGYSRAARPEAALPVFRRLLAQLEADMGSKVETGIFGADMKVELVNNGPVTIIIDSRNRE